jgi:acyl transferase domain-containing protein/acyl carrier protein
VAHNFPPHAIAIVGMSGRFPGAPDLQAFWRNIREGVEVLERFSDADLAAAGIHAATAADPRYVRNGSALQDAESFDAAFFGITPREAQLMDPQQRVFLECAWEALENSGNTGTEPELSVGVYGGAGFNSYLTSQLMHAPDVVAAAGGYQVMLANDKDFLCTRVSYKLDLRGPSVTVQTACSTSLVAVVMACRALARGECDLALAGGVSIGFPQRAGYLHQEGMILSPDGRCRPFDVKASGTRPSSGCGVVLLKRLDDALADGDTIYAVVRGAAMNNDGAAKAGYTAPSVDGQVDVIATAQALADVDARSVQYVEAHGTGTPLGDPIEVAALTQVFRAASSDIGFCRLGSLKANLGHLDTAAGVASLIKASLVLSNRCLPPLVNFTAPNPQLGLLQSPFSVSASAAAWEQPNHPRRAGVSSFGIGGTNAHVVLEEAPVVEARPPSKGPHLFLLSARTTGALELMAKNLTDHLAANPTLDLRDVEYTLQKGRRTFAHRRMCVVNDKAATLVSQTAVHEGGASSVVFLFSGQGSQYPRMSQGLYSTEAVYREVIDRCAELLKPHIETDLRGIMFDEAASARINETRFAQPALFASSLALAKFLESCGIRPSAMLGHSIGEYVAAHLAGVLSLEDALKVVAGRGRLMQSMAPGTMAAVHLPAAELRGRLLPQVEIAAVNAPGLCVISGPVEAVGGQLEMLRAAGIESRALHTSHAFHSKMMEPALAEFGALMQSTSLKAPTIPYVSNLTGTWITPQQAQSARYYVDHLRSPVLFESGVRAVAVSGALLIEVGPGNALTTLARLTLGRDGATRVIQSLGRAQESGNEPANIREAVGRLWLRGANVDFRGLHADSKPRKVPLPTYPFERVKFSVTPTARSSSATAPRASEHQDDWFYAHSWVRDDSTFDSAALDGTWIIVGNHGEMTHAVASAFAAAGATPLVVSSGTDALRKADEQTAGVVYLRDAAASSHLDAYDSLIAIGTGLSAIARRSGVQLLYVTTRAQSVLSEQVVDPTAALAVGPVKVLPTEVPGLHVRSVDLDPRDTAAAAANLVEEAAAIDGIGESAWRDRVRWIRKLTRVSLPAADPDRLPLKPRGVYLITGGTGGMGLSIAKWLAENYQARLLLTSRKGSVPAEAVLAIEQSGGSVRVEKADAADAAAMSAAIKTAVRAWGAIDGVIHAAGVSGSGTLAALKSPEESRTTLAPKVGGLQVLVEILGSEPLDFVALMSSVNSVAGTPGTVDYAGANAVLDAFPQSAARPAGWRRVMTFNWGAWKDVGMAAQLQVPASRRAQWEAFLANAIEPRAGVESFARGLASNRSRVVVASYDLLAQERAAEEQAGSPRAPTPQAGDTPSTVTNSASGVAPGPVEAQVAAIWSDLLGIPQIGLDDDFFQLGGHSLLATRVLARLEEVLGARLSLRDIFEAPTVRQTSDRIQAARGAPAPVADESEREEIEF